MPYAVSIAANTVETPVIRMPYAAVSMNLRSTAAVVSIV
jgi:hypothetical protein